MSFDLWGKIDHKVLGKRENIRSKPINEKNTYEIRELKYLRNENPHRIIICHINMNLIKNKFESFLKYVDNNLYILIVSETKIDDIFPESQFLMETFATPYRLDRTANGGATFLYIREDIPSKYLKKTP